MNVQCFYVEPIGRANVYLRRWRTGPKDCPIYGSHDALILVGSIKEPLNPSKNHEKMSVDDFIDDHRWPDSCDCGYKFSPLDSHDIDEIFYDSFYRQTESGEIRGINEWMTRVGCMWDSFGRDSGMPGVLGPDGLSLSLVCPGGMVWHIDGRANNCTSICSTCGRPYSECLGKSHEFKDKKPHTCWVRRGSPPNITVTSGDGRCGRGVVTPIWAGTLKNGILVESALP